MNDKSIKTLLSDFDNNVSEIIKAFEKIWLSLLGDKRYCNQIEDYENMHVKKIGGYFDKPQGEEIYPKLHTIRTDTSNRWKPGMDIHSVINNRTKDRFQFAPIIKCKSVQSINITNNAMGIYVTVDGKTLDVDETIQLAINDGFLDLSSFFNFFRGEFNGKIIHWTDKKY